MTLIPGRDYIGVGAGAVVARNGRVFLSQRGSKARNEQGLWEFPGGMVEFGDTLEQTLRREIKEEYGFEIEIVELLHVVDHILDEGAEHWVSPTFLCRYKSGEPKIREPDKCSQIGWYSLEDVKNMNLSQVTQEDIKALESRFPKQLPIW